MAYMNYLSQSAFTKGATKCDNWTFALWAYNGGLGWVKRDKALTTTAGKDALKAADVRPLNAGRGKAFFEENRHYDLAILQKRQVKYANWGGQLVCMEEGKTNVSAN